jgi:ATP-dependent Lon protease
MTTSHGPRKRLPKNPSEENLRKQAKRLAAQEDLQLAAAQRRLAIEYGYSNWADLIRAVASRFVPLVALRGLIAFPHEVYPIFIGRRQSLRAIEAVEDPKTQISLAANSPIFLVAQRDARVAAPTPADMYQVGTLGVIVQRERFSDGTVKILVEGKKRARVARFVFGQKFFKAEVEQIDETERLDVQALHFGLSQSARSARLETLMRSVLSAFHSYAQSRVKIPPELANSIEAINDPSILSDKMVGHLNIELAEHQALLESAKPIERLEKILGYLEAAH